MIAQIQQKQKNVKQILAISDRDWGILGVSLALAISA